MVVIIIIIIIIIITIILSRFSQQRELMDFRWSLTDSVSSDLNTEFWLISTIR